MSGSVQSSRPSYDPRELLNAQPVIVAVIDPDTYTVQFQNETGLKKFGDISGLTCHEKIAGCLTPCAFCKMPEAVRTGKITASEVPISENQWVLVQWSKAVTADGRTHVIEAITDITERKRLEAAAQQAEKMEALSRLAGGLAHDFNNLLTVIHGFSEQALGASEDRVQLRSRVKHIQEAAERATQLTRNLTAFGHQQVLQPAILEPNAIIADMESMIRQTIGERVTLTVMLNEAAGQVVADQQQLRQIIMNLVTNAHESMPQGGTLTITTTAGTIDEATARRKNVRPGSYVHLSFRDTGYGVKPDALAHIFEPFYAKREAGRGNGLALASVYGMVKQSGGFLEVASQPGAGSVFTVCLPCCGQVSAAQPAPRQQKTLTGRETILLVEDDEDVRIAVGDMLRAAGYQVQEASDGAQALEMLYATTGPLDLVLTDVMMPRMTGPHLVKQMETILPTVKVLFMSGYADEILDPAVKQHLAFIQKPFTTHSLIQKIRQTLVS